MDISNCSLLDESSSLSEALVSLVVLQIKNNTNVNVHKGIQH